VTVIADRSRDAEEDGGGRRRNREGTSMHSLSFLVPEQSGQPFLHALSLSLLGTLSLSLLLLSLTLHASGEGQMVIGRVKQELQESGSGEREGRESQRRPWTEEARPPLRRLSPEKSDYRSKKNGGRQRR